MAIKYFLRDTSVMATCDTTEKNRDLDQVQGTPAQMTTENVGVDEVWTVVLVLDEDVSGDSPGTADHEVSVDINTLSAGGKVRWRIQAVDITGCSVSASSAYSAIYSTNGIKTDTLSLTWAAGDDILRLSMEVKRDSGTHGNKNANLNINDPDSFVNSLWPGGVTENGAADLDVTATLTAKAKVTHSAKWSKSFALSGVSGWPSG